MNIICTDGVQRHFTHAFTGNVTGKLYPPQCVACGALFEDTFTNEPLQERLKTHTCGRKY